MYLHLIFFSASTISSTVGYSWFCRANTIWSQFPPAFRDNASSNLLRFSKSFISMVIKSAPNIKDGKNTIFLR